jgi:hypothetical protein
MQSRIDNASGFVAARSGSSKFQGGLSFHVNDFDPGPSIPLPSIQMFKFVQSSMLDLGNGAANGMFDNLLDTLFSRPYQRFNHVCALKHMVVSQIDGAGRKRRLRPEAGFMLMHSFSFGIFPQRYSETLTAMLWQQSRELPQQCFGQNHSTLPALLGGLVSLKCHLLPVSLRALIDLPSDP